METIFMNTENIKTNVTHKFLPNLLQRLALKSEDKHVALQNLSIYYTWKNIRQQYKNKKIKIVAPTWNNEFELSDGSYSVSDIQDYVEYIIKKDEPLTTIPRIHVYINRINNRLVFEMKDGYKLELQTPETIKLFDSTKNNRQNKNGENVPNFEVVEVVLVQSNLLSNQYQQKPE